MRFRMSQIKTRNFQMMMWLVTKTLKATSRWSWNKITITRISTSSSHLTIVYPILQCKSRVSLKFVCKKWQKYLVICVHCTPHPTFTQSQCVKMGWGDQHQRSLSHQCPLLDGHMGRLYVDQQSLRLYRVLYQENLYTLGD